MILDFIKHYAEKHDIQNYELVPRVADLTDFVNEAASFEKRIDLNDDIAFIEKIVFVGTVGSISDYSNPFVIVRSGQITEDLRYKFEILPSANGIQLKSDHILVCTGKLKVEYNTTNFVLNNIYTGFVKYWILKKR